MNKRTNTRTIRAIAIIIALATTGFTSANILITINSPTNYNYIVHKVPDFDQVRHGLPNSGFFYCVPTSSLNWFAYIANHGYPEIVPGPGDWSQQSKFSTVTTHISVLGFLMGTDPHAGTSLSSQVNVTKPWLSGGSVGPIPAFAVMGQRSSSNSVVSFEDLANHALLGRLVTPYIGWYDMSAHPWITRAGGHATSMTRATSTAGFRTIGFNDPANHNGDLHVQSAFNRQDYTITDETVIVGVSTRTMPRVNDYGSSSKQGYIDGYVTIMPIFGLTTSPDNTGVVMKKPFVLGSAQPSEVNFPTGGTIQNLKISSDALSAITMSSTPPTSPGTSSIKKIDFVTGQVQTLVNFGLPSFQIATGRFGDIYVLHGGGQPSLSRFVAGSPKPITIPLPESMTAITYDDFTDTVLLFAHQTKRLYRYQKNFAPGAFPTPHEIFQLPDTMSIFGNRQLVVHPVTGHIWYSTNASANFWEIILPGDGSVIANPITAPNSTFSSDVSFDDAGYMYCCDLIDDVVRMYAPHQPGEDSLTLLGPEDHPLANSPCRLRFAMLTSRNNFDPAVEEANPEEWIHILPTEFTPSIPGCPADLDGNGIVNVTDLLLLLAEWGTTTGFSDADLNFDGLVNVSDLLELLAAWGPCP